MRKQVDNTMRKNSGTGHTITMLSLSMIRKNKSRSALITISIVLTTLLLTVIASYGYGIVKSNHDNAAALYGSYDGIYSGVGEEQLHNMSLRSEFSTIGRMAQAGSVQSEKEMSLIWADETALSLVNMDKKLESGRFPSSAEEIAAQPGFFKKIGYENPSIGDTVQLAVRFSKQDYFQPETFVISGLIEENQSQGTSGSYSAFVSSDYYERKAAPEQRMYNAYFRLSDSVDVASDNAEALIKDLAKKCGIDERFISTNGAYLIWSRDPGTQTIVGCVMIALLVILFSVMIIYNIFQTGIAYRVREYGKLKALGATKKQMKKIVFREGMLLALIGIPIGLAAGYLTATLSFNWLMEQSMQISAGESLERVSLFSVPIFLLVAVVSAAAVWITLKRPMKIVSAVSPVEAMRYQGASGRKNGYRKGKKEIGVRDMTFAGLTNNKKRTVMTIVTMGLSCVLFVSMANFAGNMDAQYDARKQVAHGQFQIELDYSLNDTAYPENNLDSVLNENPLKGELADEIREIEGVTSVTSQQRLAAFLHQGDVSGISDSGEADSSSEASGGAEGGMQSVAVLNRADFEREKEQGATMGIIDYDQASADDAILYGWSHFLAETGYELNDIVNLTLDSGEQTADLKMPLIGAFGNASADWVITEDTYYKLGFSGDSPGILWIDCSEEDVDQIRTLLYDLTSATQHIEMQSYKDALASSEMGMKMMKLFAYGLTGLIALISFMNMANTMITGIITRKQEFGVLQAIGMTNRQLNKMLREEGLFFTLGTAVVAVAAGVPAGYALFSYGASHSWIGLHEYHLPIAEIAAMVIALAVLQLILSFALSRNVKRESLVERIRYQG